MPEATAPAAAPRSPDLAVGRGWLALFAASLLLYGATASRGVQWADSTHFMYRIVHGDLVGSLGLALSHPLHQWLGRLAHALGGPHPVVITWVSSVAGALGVANVFGCVAALTGRWGPSLFAAASLALASSYWRISTLTEVYSVSAALLAGVCWCTVLWVRDGRVGFLWLACLLNGLGGANDLQSGLAVPVLVALVGIELARGRITPSQAAVAAGAWLVGVMPYGGLVLAELFRSGDLAATLRSALFGTMWADEVIGKGLSMRVLLVDVGYPLLNFPNLLLPASAYGLWHARHVGVPVRARRTLAAILAVQAAFALRYDVVEQYNFLIPVYVLLVIFGGVGALAWRRRHPQDRLVPAAAAALLAATPLVYAGAASIARSYGVLDRFVLNKPYRDDYAYLMLPWSVAERSADRLSRHVLELAGPDGRVVFEDWMAQYAVRYQALLQGREEPPVKPWNDPEMEDFVHAAVAAGQPVVLIPRDRDAPKTTAPVGAWRREGDLYVLEP